MPPRGTAVSMTQDKKHAGMKVVAARDEAEALVAASPLALFDEQERSVLALAARDPLASIAFDKRRRRGWRALVFGAPFNFCLANDRLEVLRVTAILLREGRIAAEPFQRFRMAGFSRGQFDALAVLFAGISANVPSSSAFDIAHYREAA
ncbi:hypothetical protein [Novosphingobium sp. KA1]|uniref:hypothetical protein n=1 Tax=Novosphingobium sp. (strain KA1) TaxID=164608 RepID=UPI001A8C96DE|nr:hypothetical protein [Novosphingobium sp. KA1]